ncbi:hypothetical protein [Enterobacter roggenkampii]|uniref:hypothetical protein n=1 Tax=Enterobacter roggenkampii TaxID=1812935 RepID=UPI003B9732DA
MLIGLGDGVEDGHGGQDVRGHGFSGVNLLLCGFRSRPLLTGGIVVMHGQPAKADNQARHNRGDDGGKAAH